MSKSAEVLLAFEATVREQFKDEFNRDASIHPMLVHVARAICEAEGWDPDEVVMGGRGITPALKAKGSVSLSFPIQPAWALFLNEARAAVGVLQ